MKKQRVLDAWREKQDHLLQCFDLEKFQKETKNLEDAMENIGKKFAEFIPPNSLEEFHKIVSYVNFI